MRFWISLAACLLIACQGDPLDPCDKEGAIYTCSCTKRCNGTTSTYTTTTSCVTGGEPSVIGSCQNSCNPTATCTECSCTRGSACTVETMCH